MCRCHPLPRRRLLTLMGAAATAPLLGGCGEELPFDLVSDSTVVEMGLKGWEEIRAKTPVSQDARFQNVLDQISARLLDAIGANPADWETVVFASPQVNAFALPGNKIGVFEGMFQVIGSADQLAAIVGHEIGHLQAEHGKERMNAQVAKEFGMRLISLLLQLGDVEYAVEIAAALGIGVEYGLVLPYSRNQELEADRLGLVTMAQAGFEPAEAVELWRRMEAAGGSRVPDFLATHPAPQARIRAIEEMLPQIRAS